MPLVLRHIINYLVIFNFLAPRGHWAQLTVHTVHGALFPLKKFLSVGIVKGVKAEGELFRNHSEGISKLHPLTIIAMET